MTAVQVRSLEVSETDAAMATLTLAFSTDPCIRYSWTRADVFLPRFPKFAGAMGGAAFAAGTAHVADESAAVALWLPPGVHSDSAALGALFQDGIPQQKLDVIGQVVTQMSGYHPSEPHWYLSLIGVDPAMQGRGLGSALLKHGLRRCDEDGVIAYLESSNPKNVPLYERFGFEVVDVIQPGDFPPLYPMLRAARS